LLSTVAVQLAVLLATTNSGRASEFAYSEAAGKRLMDFTCSTRGVANRLYQVRLLDKASRSFDSDMLFEKASGHLGRGIRFTDAPGVFSRNLDVAARVFETT